MFLLCRCDGLLGSIAALHGLDVGRYGLGWIRVCFLNQDLQDCGGFTGLGRCISIVFTLTFDSSPIKGEGDWRLDWPCCHQPLTSGLRIKSAMTGRC